MVMTLTTMKKEGNMHLKCLKCYMNLQETTRKRNEFEVFKYEEDGHCNAIPTT